jgi:glycosyltransferase involved in cell wall biosynthesis
MTKRILQIIPTLDRAGAEKQLCLLAQGLPRDEFEVQVCALTRGGPLAEELAAAGIPVVVIGKRWKLDPQAFWRLREQVARFQPDLIHTWMFAANAYGYAVARACGVKNVVAGQRCVDPWKSRPQLAIDRILARRCRRVVVNSEGVRDFYVQHGTPAEQLQVIANGVALPDPPAATRRQLLAELELPEDSRLIGLVGRLWPQKRAKDAIWAADLLKVIRNDVHLLVIGDGPHRDRLRRFRDQVRIVDKVHFLGERGDVPRLMPHFDVLWSTSGYEGQSNAILEAMAAGVPVVATDIPGTRELVLPDVTGFLVRVGDRAGFAKYTERVLNDSALATRLSIAARHRAESEFSVQKMIARHAELYRELLDH